MNNEAQSPARSSPEALSTKPGPRSSAILNSAIGQALKAHFSEFPDVFKEKAA